MVCPLNSPEGSGGGVGVGVGAFGADDGGEAAKGVVGVLDVVEGGGDGGELAVGGVVVVESIVGEGTVFDDEVAEGVVGVGRGADGVGHGSFTVHVSVWRTQFRVCHLFQKVFTGTKILLMGLSP